MPHRSGARRRFGNRGTAGATSWSSLVGHWGGGAYGMTDASTETAIRLAARTEALALDPVYAGREWPD